MVKKGFFEKIENFVNKYKQTIFVLFMILILFRQCSITSDINKINKKQTNIGVKVDSLNNVINYGVKENKETIEALLIVIDNKNLKISNDELYKNLRNSNAKVAKLLEEKKKQNE